MSKKNYLFTSESVSEGHPDKVCDQISDAILDALLEKDPSSRVACECLTTTDLIVVSGEITSRGVIDYQEVARRTIEEIGYTKEEMGFTARGAKYFQSIHRQSPDIALGVDESTSASKDQGAGDQGMMFGYACDETPELMPLPIQLAQQLVLRQSQVRKAGKLPWLRPDAKSQVTIEYDSNDKPVRIHTVVLSTQHDPLFGGDKPTVAELKKEHDQIEKEVIEHIIKPVLPAAMVDKDLIIHVNPTGRFVIGGPHGDTGLTGRKIIVDTYGGMGRHGGGAFSGKDPSKVDRSAAYAARWIAKNIVAGGAATRCEVQISYAIGVAQPTSIHINTFGTGRVSEEKIEKAVRDTFDLRPRAIIEALNLRRPIYRNSAAYGHFGRENCGFTWEETQHAGVFAELAGCKCGCKAAKV
ncbi:methionine adenosyltransferase [bacterium]|nr:methionine adenosyltransferase [bacterium]